MTTPTQPIEPAQFKASGAAEWRSLACDAQAEEGEQNKVNEAKATLKKVLLESLQMQNIVILAGLGTSLSAGGPSMNDLWCAAIGAEPSDTAKATATKINYDLGSQNIEAFLSTADAFFQVHDDGDVKNFVSSCKKVILEKCSDFLDAGKLEAHQTFLHRLSRRRVRDPRLKVFTTNYDLCFQRAVNELGGVAIDGFSFTSPRRYDPRYFGYDIIRRPRGGDDLGNFLEGVFLLYKLHGSVNWARSDDGTILEKAKPSPEEACLIYPASGKYQQSFLQPYLESMSQYLVALREPNTCLIVTGCGFNDDHLAEPLLAAVRSNPHLRLIIADPHASDRNTEEETTNPYWQQLFSLGEKDEDVWFVNASFRQFTQIIRKRSINPI